MPVPVLVRNCENGPAVFTEPVAKVQIEWQGAGDPAGNDHQYVPQDLLDNVNFQRALNRGIFEVVTPDTPTRLAPGISGPYAGNILDTSEVVDLDLDSSVQQITTNTPVPDAIRLQREDYQRRKAEGEQITASAIENTENRDLIVQKCIGPNGRPGPGKCGAEVPVVEARQYDAAPLCSQHESLRANYVPTDTEDMDPKSGRVITTWSKVRVG